MACQPFFSLILKVIAVVFGVSSSDDDNGDVILSYVCSK